MVLYLTCSCCLQPGPVRPVLMHQVVNLHPVPMWQFKFANTIVPLTSPSLSWAELHWTEPQPGTGCKNTSRTGIRRIVWYLGSFLSVRVWTETRGSSCVIHHADTGWSTFGLRVALVSSTERADRFDCWKLSAQEQCTCVGVEPGRPGVPNIKSICARCPFYSTGTVWCRSDITQQRLPAGLFATWSWIRAETWWKKQRVGEIWTT